MRSSIALLIPLSLGCGETINTSKPLTLPNRGGGPDLEVTESIVDFGQMQHGTTGSETLIVKNVGGEELEITHLVATTPFTISTTTPILIAPGTSSPINIQYLADGWHPLEGAITITSNDEERPQEVVSIFSAVITDGDGDGADTLDAGGDDCNDNDPDIYPGAVDEWYDGVDANCDGADDYDQDGDGYQTLVWNEDVMSGGGDCQDANAYMYPGAPDAWYDGIDSNCDGADDYDRDNDGYRSLAEGRGLDCDDFDASVNGAATESLNGRDDDCDGSIDNDAAGWLADRTYYGASGNDMAGFHLTAGDLNQDGYDDLIVGSPGYSSNKGHVSVFSGANMPADGSTIDYAANDFTGGNTSDEAGTYLGVYENFTGANLPMLAIGEPGYNSSAGRISFLSGSDAISSGGLSDAVFTISGESGHALGSGFAQDIDMNGDGIDDIAGRYTSNLNGNVWLLYGDDYSGDIPIEYVDARYNVSVEAPNMMRSFPNGGDLDGDGFDDIVYCDGTVDVTYENALGAVWVLWGSSFEHGNASPEDFGNVDASGVQTGAADLILTGDRMHHSGEGCGVGPDWDGDGDAELWVFYPGDAGDFTGFYLVPGSVDLRDAVTDPRDVATHYYSTRPTNAVNGFRNVGDWDGDGIGDIGVSFSQESLDGGQAWIVSSSDAPGEYSNKNVASIEGSEDENQVRYGNTILSRPADFDGDGKMDWAASDWAHKGTSGGSSDLGAIFLNFNQSSN